MQSGRLGFWAQFSGWMQSARFQGFLISLFKPYIDKRLKRIQELNQVNAVQTSNEMLLVRDHTNYAIGPHTDLPSRLLSLLFYLPRDDSLSHLGTSIYMPKDPAFTCLGGPHHHPDGFDRVQTMPYKPNSLFAFLKSDKSFHGVELIEDQDVKRDLLLYDIRLDPTEATPAKLRKKELEKA